MKSAGNAVIPTYPTRWSHGLQHLRHKQPTLAFSGENGYTRHPSPEPRTQRLTRRNTGRFGWGRYYYPRSVSHVSETLRGQVSERQTLPLLRLDPVCSRRTQRAFRTAMRLCASLFRGATAPLGRVIFFVSVEIATSTLCAQGFPRVRDEGGITLPSARFACCRNAGRPLVKTAHLPFSGVAEHHSLLGPFFANI